MDKQRASAPLGGALLLLAVAGRWHDLITMIDLIDSLGLPDWTYTTIGITGLLLIVYSRWPKSATQKAAEQHQWSEEGLLQDARDRRIYHRNMFPYYLGILLIVAVFILLFGLIITQENQPESPENTIKLLYRECLRDIEGTPEVCNSILELERHK